MGVLRFLVPRRHGAAANAAERAYFSGLDEIPWQSRVQWEGDLLTLTRLEHDSGNFHIPWIVPGHGELMLVTGSLMERAAVYHLPVELARGTLNRIRHQIAAWQAAGLVLPEPVSAGLTTALGQLSHAATEQDKAELAAEHAERSLVAMLDALAILGAAYTDQALILRRKQMSKAATLLGVNLGSAVLKEPLQRETLTTFNTVSVPMSWRDVEGNQGKPDWTASDWQIEWARANNLRICGGPLVRLDRWSLPDWIYLWEDDEENLLSMIAAYVRAAVTRYRGKVNLWQCAARLNTGEALAISEEQRLRLAVLAIETTRQIDPRSPAVIVVDQPWAEFMGRKSCDFSPLHFADALVRADLGLAGIGLEINLGYHPDGTQPRDLLDFSRQLDRWSCLGLPLMITLTVPSGDGKDALARSTSKPVEFAPGGTLTTASQRQWVEQYLPLLLSKFPVQGILWNQLTDSQPHDFPHGGLFDAEDHPKPALDAINGLWQKYFE